MLPLPDRIWIARREYSDYAGTRLVEVIVYHESELPMFRAHGYEVTAFVSQSLASGRAHVEGMKP